jgi:hypothetical protein
MSAATRTDASRRDEVDEFGNPWYTELQVITRTWSMQAHCFSVMDCYNEAQWALTTFVDSGTQT